MLLWSLRLLYLARFFCASEGEDAGWPVCTKPDLLVADVTLHLSVVKHIADL